MCSIVPIKCSVSESIINSDSIRSSLPFLALDSAIGMVDFKSPPPFKKSPPCLISKPAAFFSKPAGFFSEAVRVFFDPFHAFLSGLSCSFQRLSILFSAASVFLSSVARVFLSGLSCSFPSAVHTFFSNVRVSFVGILCLSERTFMFLSTDCPCFFQWSPFLFAIFQPSFSTISSFFFLLRPLFLYERKNCQTSWKNCYL